MPQRTKTKPISKVSSNNASSQSIPPPAAKSVSNSPQQSNNLVSQSPSIMDSMKQGFSFGVGSSIAHNMVNKIFNTNDKSEPVDKKTVDEPTPTLTTDKIYDLYNKCLQQNDYNANKCIDILEKNK